MRDRETATVVIVEDNAALAQALEALVYTAGYRCRRFANAEEALSAEMPPPPCCLLTDLCLPGMSGAVLQDKLISAGSHIPVLVMSAHASAAAMRRARRRGAFACLRKPFDPEELLAHTARALDASCVARRDAER